MTIAVIIFLCSILLCGTSFITWALIDTIAENHPKMKKVSNVLFKVAVALVYLILLMLFIAIGCLVIEVAKGV